MVPDELTRQEVIDALLNESKIPKLDYNGNGIDDAWELYYKCSNDYKLMNKKTLKDAEVIDGAKLLVRLRLRGD